MSEQQEIAYKLKSGSPYECHIKRQQLSYEYAIAVQQMSIIRDKLAKCAREETVNQFRNCKELREKYLALQQDRYHGMLFPEELEPTNRNLPGVIVPKKDTA